MTMWQPRDLAKVTHALVTPDWSTTVCCIQLPHLYHVQWFYIFCTWDVSHSANVSFSYIKGFILFLVPIISYNSNGLASIFCN